MKRIIKHLPNFITILRILAIGVIFFFFPLENNTHKIIVLLLFFFFSIADFLDGWLARRLNSVTKVGKFLDHFSDKISIILIIIIFHYQLISLFPLLVIFISELTVLCLAGLAANSKITLKVRFLGKLKIALLMIFIFLLLAKLPVIHPETNVPFYFKDLLSFLENYLIAIPGKIMYLATTLVIFITLLSLLEYIKDFYFLQKKEKK